MKITGVPWLAGAVDLVRVVSATNGPNFRSLTRRSFTILLRFPHLIGWGWLGLTDTERSPASW